VALPADYLATRVPPPPWKRKVLDVLIVAHRKDKDILPPVAALALKRTVFHGASHFPFSRYFHSVQFFSDKGGDRGRARARRRAPARLRAVEGAARAGGDGAVAGRRRPRALL